MTTERGVNHRSTSRRARWALATLVMVVVSTAVLSWLSLLHAPSVSSASSPSRTNDDPSTRRDVYGDPLPRGAVDRLGTLRFLVGPGGRGLDVTGDGKQFVVGTRHGRIAVFDLTTGVRESLLQGHDRWVRRRGDAWTLREFAPLPMFGVRAGWTPDRLIDLWVTTDGSGVLSDGPVARFADLRSGRSVQLETSPSSEWRQTWRRHASNGRRIIRTDATEGQFAIRVLDPSWRDTRRSLVLQGAGGQATSDVSADGRHLALTCRVPNDAGRQIDVVRLIEIESGRTAWETPLEMTTPRHLRFNSDGSIWVTTLNGQFERIRADGVHQGKVQLRELLGSASSIGFSADGARVALGHYGRVQVASLEDEGAIVAAFLIQEHLSGSHRESVPYGEVALTPDGEQLLYRRSNGRVAVVPVVPGSEARPTTRSAAPVEHNAWIRRMAWSPEGRRLVSVDAEGVVLLWHLPSKQATWCDYLQATGRWFSPRRWAQLAFSADGSEVLALCAESHDEWDVRRWSADDGDRLSTVAFSNALPFGMADMWLAKRSDHVLVRAVSGAPPKQDWSLIHVVSGERSAATASDALHPWPMDRSTPDGGLTIRLDWSRQVERWELTARDGSEEPVWAQTEQFADPLEAARLNGDGYAGFPRRAAGLELAEQGRVGLAFTDRPYALLFDVRTGRTIAELRGHRGTICAAQFSPDGTRLATGGSDGTILIWDVTELIGER